jgi:photosynthetic reaction center H subunit
MVGVTFFGNVDLALLTTWAFWLFFAGLVYWLQRENMREGYPLEDELGNPAVNQGPFSLPAPKTFLLPFGRGEVSYPNMQREARDVALTRTEPSGGYPLTPTGDPMLDGVGPASWAPRRDVAELDGHGHNKIIPMATRGDFTVSAGRDPRGLPVQASDLEAVGVISDMWIDAPEQLVRYLEIELKGGAGKRLVPMTLAKIKSDRVKIDSLPSDMFSNVPQTKSPTEVTMLEEEKISAFYCGGILFCADRKKADLAATFPVRG